MTLEYAAYFRLLLLSGYDEELKAYIDQALEEQDPISEIVLALSTAEMEHKDLLTVINEYLIRNDPTKIDYDTEVYDLICRFLHKKFIENDMELGVFADLMLRLCIATERWEDSPWFDMYKLACLWDEAEIGLIDRKQYLDNIRHLLQPKLKYPLLLVHGMGYRDDKAFSYWGRIPKALEEMGCKVYFGNQDGNGDVESNGKMIAQRIRSIIKETGAEKLNIIAHSKGGLDSRYAVSVLGCGELVASLTTLATPHNGSKTLDKLLKLPKWILKTGCFFADCFYKLLGDQNPQTYTVIHSFTTENSNQFNEAVKDYEGTYCQSYAFVMEKASDDILLWLPYLVVDKIEGENDGLLTPDAVKWGNYRGCIKGIDSRGISHLDEIDLRRSAFQKEKGEGLTDILDLYRKIVTDLAERGF